jgi:hypothetical protein
MAWLTLLEVMDKEVAPWEVDRVAVTALVAVLCWALGRRGYTIVFALALALAWAFLNLEGDDLYDPMMGPTIERELSTFSLRAYQVLLPLEALLPAGIVLAQLGRRLLEAAQAPRRQGAGSPSPSGTSRTPSS